MLLDSINRVPTQPRLYRRLSPCQQVDVPFSVSMSPFLSPPLFCLQPNLTAENFDHLFFAFHGVSCNGMPAFRTGQGGNNRGLSSNGTETYAKRVATHQVRREYSQFAPSFERFPVMQSHPARRDQPKWLSCGASTGSEHLCSAASTTKS